MKTVWLAAWMVVALTQPLAAESLPPRGDLSLSGYFGEQQVNAIGPSIWSQWTGSPVTGPAIISGKILFFTTEDGKVHALDIGTGHYQWEYQLKKGTSLPYSSPANGDGVLCLGTKGFGIVALEEKTGDLLWRRKISDVTSSPVIMNGSIYIGADSRIYSLELKTGKTRWSVKAPRVSEIASAGGYDPSTFAARVSTPVIDGHRLFFSSFSTGRISNPVGLAVTQESILGLFCVDIDSGKVVWRREFSCNINLQVHPVLHGDNLILPDLKGTIRAFNVENGESTWKFDAGRPVNFPPAAHGNSLYFGNDEGKIFCIDAGDGGLKWSAWSDTPVTAAPSISGTTVFFRDRNGGIIGLDLATGQRTIDHRFFKAGRDTMVIFNGRIFVGTEYGEFNAISIL